MTGLLQFLVPAAEGGSNLAEKLPYATLGKPLHELSSRLDLYRDICSVVVLCLCTMLIYVHLFGLGVLTGSSHLSF